MSLAPVAKMGGPTMIVGLGNPGKEYENTRHNVGQQAITRLFARHATHLTWGPERGAFVGKGMIKNRKILLLTPAEFYMNESGTPVRKISDFYKIPSSDLLIVYDDKELPLGTLRLRPSGSAGGHNGMRSIIEQLGTEDIARLRIGIGTELGKKQDASQYVLGKMTHDEKTQLFDALEATADAIECYLRDGMDVAMNKYNR